MQQEKRFKPLKVEKCSEHPELVLRDFCTQCKCVFCEQCTKTKKCVKEAMHNTITLTELRKNMEANLSKKIAESEKRMKEIKEANEKITVLAGEAKRAITKLKENIEETSTKNFNTKEAIPSRERAINSIAETTSYLKREEIKNSERLKDMKDGHYALMNTIRDIKGVVEFNASVESKANEVSNEPAPKLDKVEKDIKELIAELNKLTDEFPLVMKERNIQLEAELKDLKAKLASKDKDIDEYISVLGEYSEGKEKSKVVHSNLCQSCKKRVNRENGFSFKCEECDFSVCQACALSKTHEHDLIIISGVRVGTNNIKKRAEEEKAKATSSAGGGEAKKKQMNEEKKVDQTVDAIAKALLGQEENKAKDQPKVEKIEDVPQEYKENALRLKGCFPDATIKAIFEALKQTGNDITAATEIILGSDNS